MKINIAHHSNSYSFKRGEQILFDANIWLSLFPAPQNPTNSYGARNYYNAFSNLLKAKAQPVLDPLVLSEYLNVYFRIEWNARFKSQYPIYKSFRNSSDFLQIAQRAKTNAQNILQNCVVHSLPPNDLCLVGVIDDMGHGRQIDFNDAIFIDICRKQEMKLMTHDADFLNGGIEILTNNQYLLSRCHSP